MGLAGCKACQPQTSKSMNSKNLLLAAVTTGLLISGCSKESTPSEGAAPTPQPQTASMLTTTVVSAVTAATNAAAQAIATVSNAPAVVSAAVTNVLATNAAPVNSIQATLEKVKALIAQQKYGEAATLLGSLKNQSLTAEQQTLWQKLQAEVQKALAGSTANDGAKALGGLIGK